MSIRYKSSCNQVCRFNKLWPIYQGKITFKSPSQCIFPCMFYNNWMTIFVRFGVPTPNHSLRANILTILWQKCISSNAVIWENYCTSITCYWSATTRIDRRNNKWTIHGYECRTNRTQFLLVLIKYTNHTHWSSHVDMFSHMHPTFRVRVTMWDPVLKLLNRYITGVVIDPVSRNHGNDREVI